jgi:polar amino acid transport system permease protein
MGNWERLVWNQRELLLSGLGVTIEICLLAFVGAIIGGLLLCLVRLYVAPLRPVAILLIEFFRATPIFVQLMWVNYVWPEVLGWPNTFFTAGWVALALQSSGYLAETFRSGIEGLPKGQYEAGLAVGMRPSQIMQRIVAPQVLLVMAPGLINQMAVVVKSSTLVSVIAIPDLMYQALRIVHRWFEPIEVLTSTALLYFVVIFIISVVANRVSDHFRTKFGLAGQG